MTAAGSSSKPKFRTRIRSACLSFKEEATRESSCLSRIERQFSTAKRISICPSYLSCPHAYIFAGDLQKKGFRGIKKRRHRNIIPHTEVLRRRRHTQAQASGEAEGRQEEDVPVRQGRHPAGGVHCGAEGRCVMLTFVANEALSTSWPGLSRPSTSCLLQSRQGKTWMPATSAGMTSKSTSALM
jgi:hypothetical protein